MKEWLDSAYAPNAQQIAQAKAAGYAGWAGYFKYGNDGVLNGWGDADFKRVLAGGLRTMAYCSGFAPPDQVRARAGALGIPACLDDESGMRPDGAWVPGWLAAAGAGLYGNYWVHNRAAAFHILAAYPTAGDPTGADWSIYYARPSGLCGWQWAGSHPLFNITVDASWFDDGIAATTAGAQAQGGTSVLIEEMLLYMNSDNQQIFVVGECGKRYVWDFETADWEAKLGTPIKRTTAQLALIPDAPYFGGTQSVNDPRKHAASEAQVAALAAQVGALPTSGGLTPGQATQLQETHDRVVKDLSV